MTLKVGWIFFVVLMVVGSLGIHIFLRYARDNTDLMSALIIAHGVAFAVCVILYFLLPSSHSMPLSVNTIIICSLVGVSIAVANIAVLGMYKAGLSVSIAVPLTRTAVAVGAVLLGVLLFSEKLTMVNMAGIVLSVISMVLLAL